ncbi:Protein of unknown function [Algoriphagus locisalis]|uniref:DinB superfamily protein n=1 Tax=Algoriphagus locisalis TaxID=305507 RepID=A0A1I7E4N5_9BACT|nr:DUF1569 domain-containing protein [Algoriphagus locisalis]SFU18783.1 Protein of unknown function [Algoriphagus locisalis]
MKTVFDKSTNEELIKRISSLSEKSKARWGKMTVYQMIRHFNLWDQWVLGIDNEILYKQSFLGKIIGKIMLHSTVKDDKPFGKNIPAGANFIIKARNGDFDFQKRKWIDLTSKFKTYNNPDFIHGLFGKMNEDQIGIFVYKHYDHHLRQFGV